MDLAQALDEINRRFYERFASDFHRSREHGWTGWHAVLDQLPTVPLRVLDVGCGNGRLAKFLEKTWCGERGAQISDFQGMDQCGPLLDFARSQPLPFPSRWSAWSWREILDAEGAATAGPPHIGDAPGNGAHWVTLFGVMHHVFGYERRLNLLLWAAARLCIGGVLTVSLWDFGAHEKWEKKRLPWADYADDLNIDVNLLEAGDYLLGWSGQTDTPRYCHWVSREEEGRLLHAVQSQAAVTLSPGERVGSDGDLNRYWCWRRTK